MLQVIGVYFFFCKVIHYIRTRTVISFFLVRLTWLWRDIGPKLLYRAFSSLQEWDDFRRDGLHRGDLFFNSLKDVVILSIVHCSTHTGRVLLRFHRKVFSSETAWARLAGVAKWYLKEHINFLLLWRWIKVNNKKRSRSFKAGRGKLSGRSIHICFCGK